MTMHSAPTAGVPAVAWAAGALVAMVAVALVGVAYLAARRATLSCCPHVELDDILEDAA